MSIDKEKFIDYYVAQVRSGNVSLFWELEFLRPLGFRRGLRFSIPVPNN